MKRITKRLKKSLGMQNEPGETGSPPTSARQYSQADVAQTKTDLRHPQHDGVQSALPTYVGEYIPAPAKTECHSFPSMKTKKFSQTDMAPTETDHGHPLEDVAHSALPASGGDYARTDEDLTETYQGSPESTVLVHPIDTNTHRHSPKEKENSQMPQGPRQISEKPPAMVNIDDLRADDIVIAIMGPTGSGKSTFIRSACGYETWGVGHTLKSFTSQVHAIRFWDQESRRHVVLVDTPGFDDTFKSDLDILTMISDWLNSSYNKNKLLSGILYLHRITDNRMAGTPLKNLRVFRKLCGKDALGKVYLTTTMWDEVEPKVGERRLQELSMDYWKGMIDQGAKTASCRSDDDSSQKLVRRILAQEGDARRVRLQEEMAEMKKELKETDAGQQLYSQLEVLVEKQTELLQRINKEKKAASDPIVVEELQVEYDELRAQIDEKLLQMDELKLPRLKTFLNRLFSFGRD